VIVYVDTSVLVKWFIAEAGSDETELFLEAADELATAAIALPEAVAAIGRRVRRGDISQADGADAVNEFRGQWPLLRKVSITDGVIDSAGQLAWDHDLRGYDAVHLAAALLFGSLVGVGITVATGDRDLRIACEAAGLDIWPPDLAIFHPATASAPP
jgi:uncharacterized protein